MFIILPATSFTTYSYTLSQLLQLASAPFKSAKAVIIKFTQSVTVSGPLGFRNGLFFHFKGSEGASSLDLITGLECRMLRRTDARGAGGVVIFPLCRLKENGGLS